MGKTEHSFGGSWTKEKLDRLAKYLNAYMQIMRGNERAQFFTACYVDAFAGTGYVQTKTGRQDEISLLDAFPELVEKGAREYIEGSASIALQTIPWFHKYIFIEKRKTHCQQLHHLKETFPDQATRIEIIQGDANQILLEWCEKLDVKTHRAVVFLDPYGMQVEWRVIEKIAQTKAIDLWILFPLSAVTRTLPKKGVAEDSWRRRVTSVLGRGDWEKEFYKKAEQLDLFGEPGLEKHADFDHIGSYFIERLKTAFDYVAENPLVLRNDHGTPLYLFCFAANNPKGGKTAVKIAQGILGK